MDKKGGFGQLGWRRRDDRGRWRTGYRPTRRLYVDIEQDTMSISISRNVWSDRETPWHRLTPPFALPGGISPGHRFLGLQEAQRARGHHNSVSLVQPTSSGDLVLHLEKLHGGSGHHLSLIVEQLFRMIFEGRVEGRRWRLGETVDGRGDARGGLVEDFRGSRFGVYLLFRVFLVVGRFQHRSELRDVWMLVFAMTVAICFWWR